MTSYEHFQCAYRPCYIWIASKTADCIYFFICAKKARITWILCNPCNPCLAIGRGWEVAYSATSSAASSAGSSKSAISLFTRMLYHEMSFLMSLL